jgi:hypothetical protein
VVPSGSEGPQVQKADLTYRAIAVSFAVTWQKAPATVGGRYACSHRGRCQCLGRTSGGGALGVQGHYLLGYLLYVLDAE